LKLLVIFLTSIIAMMFYLLHQIVKPVRFSRYLANWASG
jgi:hypothetical protein